MRVGIVDDELVELEKLQEYLYRFAQEQEISFEVDSYGNADELLNQYEMVYDILLFDINMPGTNGIEAARQIRRMDKTPYCCL